MAEFQEVMKQWRRFCKSHSNCGECEFDGKGICGETHLSDVPYSDMELRIMAWAAEHPEPVYPTWGEWLVAQDIITEYGRIECGGSGTCGIFTDKGESPIPADIAQKLGIEPVPVVHADCGATNEQDAMKKLGIEPKEGI